MRTKELIDRCYKIENELLKSVFTKHGISELHTIIFYIKHCGCFYYHGLKIDINFLINLSEKDRILLFDIYECYIPKN